MDTLLYWIGLVAVAVSALTGVLDAGRKQMDIVGAVMVGCATALGGGTVRDVLLDRTVFWISDQTYLLVAILTTLVVFFAVRGLKLPQRLFLIPDTIGLALFTIAGTQIALQWHAPWLVASLLGVITGVVGGVLRDVLCNEIPRALNDHRPYALWSFAGGWLFVGLHQLGLAPWLVLTVTVVVTAGGRLLSVGRGWAVPGWRR